jgi:hypothetical protein
MLYYVATGAPASRAAAGDEGKAVFHLRVTNTNAKYNHKSVVIKWRLLDVQPNRQMREVVPWQSIQTERLEDESSRVAKLTLARETLRAAYNPDYPLTRLEVEYHWRERFVTRGDTHYNRTGLDFWLMAPIEYLFGRRKQLSTSDVPLNDAAKHKDRFWIPLNGVEFTAELSQPVTFQLELSTALRQDATAAKTATKSTSKSTTTTETTAKTFSLSVSGEASQGSTVSGKVAVLDVGLQEMFKIGGSLGYSKTTTDTTSTTVAREFAEALTYSKSYGQTVSSTSRLTVTVSPPQEPVPRGTGDKPGKTVSGKGGVGLYLYPMVAFYEVPYVRFEGVNELGQATRRTEGTVVVPFITGWRLTTRKD